MKIGIIREGKIPPDSRVVLTPEQCVHIQTEYGIEIVVQESKTRCFADETYSQKGIKLVKNISDCDVLIGVKEVPIDQLIDNKTYFFFSHTIKAQPYNRGLLQTILKKQIRLIDYEVLTNDEGQRVIAFGRFAGMVGAHNGMMTYGVKTKSFELNRMTAYDRYKDAQNHYQKIALPDMRIVVTGKGRVAYGACEVLDDMGVLRVSPQDYLNENFETAVYTQLDCEDYAEHKEGKAFVLQDFYRNPSSFQSKFAPYLSKSNLMINGIYWDPQAPAFFTLEEMKKDDFSIQVIADVTCDIAPEASIPCTVRPSTIADPVYGFDPLSSKETTPYSPGAIDIMAVDNLPNELPKDASQSFGEQFITFVLPNLIQGFDTDMLRKATIAENGNLGPHFKYLNDFVKG